MKAIAFRLFVALIVLFGALSSRAQCTVTCTATVPSSGTAATPVAFESTATPCLCSGSPTYLWTFGDGDDSTDANPSHAYASNGTYNWQLTVTADGETCIKSGSITIGPATPNAGTYSGTTSSGHPFSLTVNASSQITGWQIGFGGLCGASGSTAVSGQSCAVTNGAFSCGTASCIPFSTNSDISGTFSSATSVSGNATLKSMPDTINCCTQTPTFSANLSPALLSASASSDVTSGNAPLTVNFTGSASGGTGPYSYSWDFGDCSVTGSTQNPSHIYAAGNYNAVLTVSDSASATAFDIVSISAAQPGITVTPASGHTTTEAGGTSTFTVVLDTQPAASVTIQIDTSDATEGRISTDGATQQTAVTLTFTTSNWSTAQTITIHGQNDNIDDGNIAYTVTTAASDSTDTSYDNIDPANVDTTNNDDDTAAYIVTPTTLSVSETATTATFDVSLATEPTGNVVVDIVSNDTGEATVSHAQLTFTSGDYATPQTVTVTGVDDALPDGDQSTTINLTTNGTTADAVYAALDPANVTVTTIDDDVLTILSTNPNENEKSASRTANIQATASDTVNASTITQSTFRVQGQQSGRINGTYGASGATFHLDPANDLKAGELITMMATSGIQDNQAIALTPYVWQFRAATSPATGALTVHPQQGGFDAGGSASVVLGDLDGDGDLDAVFGHANYGGAQIWLNNGSGVYSFYTAVTGGNISDVALGDLDNDGDLDLVIGNSLEAETVWLNDGSANFTELPTTMSSDWTSDVSLGDIDGDGDLDCLLSGQGSGTLQTIWLNDGSGGFSAHPTTPSITPSNGANALPLGDLDGDGDLDLVVANGNGQERVYVNDGTGSFSLHQTFPFLNGNDNAWDVALGDIDADLDLDVVVSNMSDELETVWVNNGSGNFTQLGSFGAGESRDISLGDLDGDGDLDAVVGNFNGSDTVWLNNGSGFFSAHPAVPTLGSGGWGHALGDVDGDGDLDAVFAYPATPSVDEKVWLNQRIAVVPNAVSTTEAGGTATFSVVLGRQPSANVALDVTTSDTTEGRISNDGSTQQNTFTLTFTTSNWSTPQVVTVHGQDDIFADGDIAYTITTSAAASSDSFYSGVNPDDVSATNINNDIAGVTVTPTTVSVNESGTTATFDVSPDTAVDGAVVIDVASTDTGEATVSHSQLTFTSTTPQTVTVTGVDDAVPDGNDETTITLTMNAVATTDSAYDAVDPADVVATTADDEELMIVSTDPDANEKAAPRTANIAATANDSIDGSTVTQSTFRMQGAMTGRIAGAYSASGATFELNPTNDLKPGELIRVTATDGIANFTSVPLTPRVWQFTAAAGTGTGALFAHPTAPRFGPDNAGDGAIADLDGDGDLDALIVGDTTLETWANNGSGVFSLAASISEHNPGDVARIALGDLDGDGDLDVVMAKWFAVGKVFVNDGTGAFTSHSFPSGGAHRYPRLGDVDGDGDLDAVVVTGTTHLDQVYTNDGAGTFTRHYTFGSSNGNNLALGDLDGDGDLDAVIVTGGVEETWMNDGSGTFTPHAGTPTFGGEDSESVALGDLDGDGDLDAVVVNDGPTDKVWVNDGTGAFSAHATTPEIAATYGVSAALGDLDGDGDLDLVVGDYSQTGQNSVWMNDGAGNLTAHPITPLFDDGQRFGGVHLGDLDGDGDLDGIGIGGYTGREQQTVWINSQIGVSPATGLTTTEAGGTATFDIRINRQPTADVMVDVSTSDSTEGRISTDGTTQQTAVTLTFTSANWNTPQTITLHGQSDAVDDGDIAYTILTSAATSDDAFFNAFDPANVSATNTDDDSAGVNVTPTEVTVSETGTTATFDVVLTSQPTGDVVVALSSLDTSEATISHAQLTFTTANWSTPRTVTVTGVSDGVNDGDQNTTIDITINAGATADASYDAIDPPNVTVTTVNVVFAITTTSPAGNEKAAPRNTNIAAATNANVAGATVTQSTFRVQGALTGRIAGAYSASGATFQLNPSADFKPGEKIRATATSGIEGSAGGNLTAYVWELTAAARTATATMTEHPVTPSFNGGPGTSSDVALGDLNGDGDVDAVISNYQPGALQTVWMNDGSGSLSPHSTRPTLSSADGQFVVLGDLDGDGDLDALIPSTDAARVWRNDGTGDFGATAHSSFGDGFVDVALGDLDGDGDLDALITKYLVGQTVWLNDGTGVFSAHPNVTSFGNAGGSAVVLGDLDGDGDLDAVAANPGLEAVWMNDGTGEFAAHPTTPTFDGGTTAEGFALGDLDGDGDLDLVVANRQSEAETVWVNDGTGAFTAHGTTPSFEAGTAYEVALGDLDGDGDLDAIFAGNAWLNDGDGDFGSIPASTFGGATVYGIALADLDGDADLDAVMAGPGDETVWVNRNEPGITVTPLSGLMTTEAGGTATFTVVLDSQPVADVTIDIDSSDITEARLSTDGITQQSSVTLTFTSSNWSTAQTVTVHGQNDLVDDGHVDYMLTTAAATSTDPLYSGLNAANVAASNTDNDTAGVTRTPSAVSVSETGTNATFTVVLNTEPTGNVVIDVASSDTGESTAAPAQLTFTSGDWSAPQTVTVTGVDDALDDGNQTSTILLTMNAALTADVMYDAINPADVTATTIDDDKSPTDTALTSSVNPSTSGQSVTFTAAVTSGAPGTITGTVTFKNGAATIGTAAVSGGSASFTTATLAPGAHSITAEYGGNSNFLGSMSNTVNQTVNISPFGAPPFFTATASSTTAVALNWGAVSGATSYEIHRTASIGSPFTLIHTTASTSYTNSGLTANTTYLYKVRAINGGGPSAFSAVDAATTVIFTDATLGGTIKIKAVHLTQLRTAVNAMRATAGLAAATFTDPTLDDTINVKKVHVTELRTALDAARAAIGLSALTYTDATLTVGVTKMKAAHVTELRVGVQ